MLELRRPLSRVMDGPGLLIQRLTALTPRLNLSTIDTDRILLSMAESDPDCLAYLDSEGLLRRTQLREEEVWR